MALVFNIQRFSINDGPGIRTNVFFKGCPLNCLWCHNPESKSAGPELCFVQAKCIGCGRCLAECPGRCHSLDDAGRHLIDRKKCLACRKCSDFCVGALEIMGREMTVEEIIDEVMKDEAFYRASGGGMTVSGGEPMIHFPFLPRLLSAARGKGLTNCVETCGFAPWERFEEILPLTDLFLYDCKETDPARHREYTGVGNGLILDNLAKLDRAGAQIVLRCPVIPGLNDREDHFDGIARLADSLENVLRIDVEPYHPLGKSKCENLGREYPLADLSFPDKAVVKDWIGRIAARTRVPVQQG